LVTSSLDELSHGHFQEVIDDQLADPGQVNKVLLTYGRIYYDLLKRRNEQEVNCVAIVRIEQLFPVPEEQITLLVRKYAKAQSLCWVQDEPENQGAWPYIRNKLAHLGLKSITRPESASPAVGLMEQHKRRLQRILDAAFEQETKPPVN